MTEDKANEREVNVDSIKEDGKPNENFAVYHLSTTSDDLNNFFDLNLNPEGPPEDELCSAPVEILSEFLSTFMSRDYKSALHYCKLILQYEPDNEIVQDFYPLILDRIDSSTSESDEFADNEGSSFSAKSESSTEYFSSASAGTENTSVCSSLSSDDDDDIDSSVESSQ